MPRAPFSAAAKEGKTVSYACAFGSECPYLASCPDCDHCDEHCICANGCCETGECADWVDDE